MVKAIKKVKQKAGARRALALDKRNYLILGIGVLTIILGYIIMATGETYSFQSLTVAPIVLLIGYLVLIPVAIMYRRREHSSASEKQE